MGRRLLLSAAVSAFALVGCATVPMVDVPSANRNERVSHLILHFTSENFAESLRLLTHAAPNPVSAHYLVPVAGDPTYPRDRLIVHRLVPESERAWHAGRSAWFGRTALNDSSIGIEIVNRSGCTLPEAGAARIDPADAALEPAREPRRLEPRSENAADAALEAALEAAPEQQFIPGPGSEPNEVRLDPVCTFLPYPDAQIDLLIALIRDVLARNPDIGPVDITGHADIAPDRKVDPGPQFPWRRLYEAGIGAWYDEATMARYLEEFGQQLPELSLLQAALSAYGYDVDISGEADDRTRFAVRAFQMHFRPADHDGRFDAETAAILFALLEKYRAGGMAERSEAAPAGPIEARAPDVADRDPPR